jgi:hypothetical protein
MAESSFNELKVIVLVSVQTGLRHESPLPQFRDCPYFDGDMRFFRERSDQL